MRRTKITPFNLISAWLLLSFTPLAISETLPEESWRADQQNMPNVVEAISITTLGAPIMENFDALPTSGSVTFTNNVTIPGWYSARTGTGNTVVADDGSNAAGNLYSYGTGTNNDRALGSVGSNNATAGDFFWGILLTNTIPERRSARSMSLTSVSNGATAQPPHK